MRTPHFLLFALVFFFYGSLRLPGYMKQPEFAANLAPQIRSLSSRLLLASAPFFVKNVFGGVSRTMSLDAFTRV